MEDSQQVYTGEERQGVPTVGLGDVIGGTT